MFRVLVYVTAGSQRDLKHSSEYEVKKEKWNLNGIINTTGQFLSEPVKQDRICNANIKTAEGTK